MERHTSNHHWRAVHIFLTVLVLGVGSRGNFAAEAIVTQAAVSRTATQAATPMRKLIISPDTPGIAFPEGVVNINGPSLIRVPDWAPRPLGRYYLYFAHHTGKTIRLAYADHLEGPWRVHDAPALDIKNTPFPGHIASPDVIVDEEARQFRMYYHGQGSKDPALPGQPTCLALSSDGREFAGGREKIAAGYLRVFRHEGWWYGLTMTGHFWRSRDGLGPMERRERRFVMELCAPNEYVEEAYQPRHLAVAVRDGHLEVYFTRIGDAPEHILRTSLRLTDNWEDWRFEVPITVRKPELSWEGADAPHIPSRMGPVNEPAWQLRDPCVFEEAGRRYLLYAVAGEQGIAITDQTE